MATSAPRAAWLALGAIAAAWGLAEGGPVSLPAPLVVALAALGLALALVLARRRHARAAASLLGSSTVALRAAVAAALVGGGLASVAPPAHGPWDATVTDMSAPSGDRQRAFLRLSPSDGSDGGWSVYAWLPRQPPIVTGDRLRVAGQLEPLPDDGSGFARFLADRGTQGTLRVRSLDLVAAGDDPAALVTRLRWWVDGNIARAMPEPEASLAAGILIGLRQRVGRDVADDFMTTGLTHVVAISGWNIALVAGIATGLLRAAGLSRRPRSMVVIAAIAAYTVVAGAEASVIRAALMGGVVLLAREGGRPAGAAAALGVACWVLLLTDPAMVGDIGLQLSLAATAGLLALGGPAEAAVRRVARGRAPRWLGETLGVSLAAQLATLPLILLHFGRLSIISPLANLLVAPVVPLAMLGAFVATLVGQVEAWLPIDLLVAPLSLLAWLPLALMVRGASLLAEVPLASLELPAPLDLAGALAALLLLTATLARVRRRTGRSGAAHDPGASTEPRVHGPPPTGRRRRRVAAVGVAGVLVVTLGAVVLAQPAALLRVTVLDVGQGDAILLETDDGHRVLVDGGPDPDLLVRRLDERIPVWDRRIDLVVLTHPHEDHAGGLAGLVPRYRIGGIAETGMASHGFGVRQLRTIADRDGIPRRRLVAGDRFEVGRVLITVLWPPADAIPPVEPDTGRGINDTSIVLRLDVGRQRALLTGDLEDDRDADLMAALGDDGQRWDLLKVAHHGSATASSLPLLERLRPRLAVISSGVGNSYGHPAPDTLSRLRSVGAAIWRTDLQGTLSLTFDGGRATAAEALARAGLMADVGRPGGHAPVAVSVGRGWYARPDGRPDPHRSAGPAGRGVALAQAAPALHRHRGGGRVPGPPSRPRGPGRGSAPRGRGRAPPRHRQGAARHASTARAGSRQGRSGMAQRGRSPGAGPGRGGAPGHAARRSRRTRLGDRGAHRGSHRVLRGQALDPSRRVAREALRALAPPPPPLRPPARRRLRGGTHA